MGAGNLQTIQLASIGSSCLSGFRIQGTGQQFLGGVVSSAGDLNNDGFGDLTFTTGGSSGGSAHVIYGADFEYVIYNGQIITGTYGTAQLGGAGFFNSAADPEGGIDNISALGNVNGDGYSDLLISSPFADSAGNASGSRFVVYGSAAGPQGDINLADVGGSVPGFEIIGESANQNLGRGASAVGDVNNDGFDDFIITSSQSNNATVAGGEAYLIYGGNYTDAVSLVAGASATNGGVTRDVVHGTALNVTIKGGGGADVIIGGGGDDRIGMSGTDFAYIDGGEGDDTLVLNDGGSFDFRNIRDTRIKSIEGIDAANNGADNDLTLSITDLFNLDSGTNTFLDTLIGPLTNAIVIDLSASEGDSLELSGSAFGYWSLTTTQSGDVPGYNNHNF